MTAVWVLPTINPGRGRKAVERLFGRDVLVVDNTAENRGVSASWNMGADYMRVRRAEWLIICSESLRMHPGEAARLEAELTASAAPWADTGYGWHLVAFRASTLERVGRFDEIFQAYMEDTDYLYRLHLAGFPSPRENARPHTVIDGIGADDLGYGLAVTDRLVDVQWADLAVRYQTKWGGPQGHEAYTTPYNDPTHDWAWTPTWQEAIG